jgi:hypothetical protein
MIGSKLTTVLLLLSAVSGAQNPAGLYCVEKNGKFGFIDKAGKQSIGYIYDRAMDPFKGGYTIVEKNGLYGVIDVNNKVVIPIEYENIKRIGSPEYFLLKKTGDKEEYYLQDVRGVRHETPFSAFNERFINSNYTLENDCIVIFVNGKYGVFNVAVGKVIIPAIYDDATLSKNGIRLLKDKTNIFTGFDGVPIFETQVHLADVNMGEGLMKSQSNRKYGLVNLKGETVASAIYGSIDQFSEKRAAFSDEKYNMGYLDEHGKVVIEPQFKVAKPFSNGVASVRIEKDGLYGLIDKSGKWIVQPKFREPIKFTSDRALAEVYDAKGKVEVHLIDVTGKLIKKMPEIEWDYPYSGFDEHGICSVHLSLPTGKICEAYIDKTGKVIWKGDPFDYCFPEDAMVTIANGKVKSISEVSIGDMVLSVDLKTGEIKPTKVIKVEIHEGSFDIVNINVASHHQLVSVDAATYPTAAGIRLRCTPNHPVQTGVGRVEAGKLLTGNTLQVLNADAMSVAPGTVSVVYPAERVNKVYNLVTESGNYIVNGVVVLVK